MIYKNLKIINNDYNNKDLILFSSNKINFSDLSFNNLSKLDSLCDSKFFKSDSNWYFKSDGNYLISSNLTKNKNFVLDSNENLNWNFILDENTNTSLIGPAIINKISTDKYSYTEKGDLIVSSAIVNSLSGKIIETLSSIKLLELRNENKFSRIDFADDFNENSWISFSLNGSDFSSEKKQLKMNTIYKVYFIITLKDSTSYTIKTIKVFNHSGGQQDLFTIKAGIELYLETSDFNSDTLDATCHFFLTNSTVISSMKIYLKDTKIMLLGSMSNADNSTDIRTFYNLSDYRTLNCVINCTPYWENTGSASAEISSDGKNIDTFSGEAKEIQVPWNYSFNYTICNGATLTRTILKNEQPSDDSGIGATATGSFVLDESSIFTFKNVAQKHFYFAYFNPWFNSSITDGSFFSCSLTGFNFSTVIQWGSTDEGKMYECETVGKPTLSISCPPKSEVYVINYDSTYDDFKDIDYQTWEYLPKVFVNEDSFTNNLFWIGAFLSTRYHYLNRQIDPQNYPVIINDSDNVSTKSIEASVSSLAFVIVAPYPVLFHVIVVPKTKMKITTDRATWTAEELAKNYGCVDGDFSFSIDNSSYSNGVPYPFCGKHSLTMQYKGLCAIFKGLLKGDSPIIKGLRDGSFIRSNGLSNFTNDQNFNDYTSEEDTEAVVTSLSLSSNSTVYTENEFITKTFEIDGPSIYTIVCAQK